MNEAGTRTLEGRRVLVVEDEYFLADDLTRALEDEGAEVAGPASSLARAWALVREQRIDMAVLDVNLQGELIFALADELRAQGVPFLFTTGYDENMIPERYGDVERQEKPLKADKVIGSLTRL